MNLSEPQLISPLLDGFVMGDPISGHDGVCSCPAMHLATDKKYIVKIISLPATQSKLDALLLAGAFTDRESALGYFQELADGVLEEAALLQKLSRHEGFVSYESWQLVPMENDDTGFDIYLLGEYRPTLDGVIHSNALTHLQAINLGLDLCAALSVSRRFGYLYGNLQPSNIYICNEREFRIGDLGFLSLDSLPYASLPDKYHSDYTPPEISDAYSALNSTMDTYAVGLILYQAYNDGRLPPVGINIEAPKHADHALSEIILKACSLDPADRWQDPVEMGQALVDYLQSNTVNDTPIVPLPVEEDIVESPVEAVNEAQDEPTTEDILAEVDQALDTAPVIVAATTTVEQTAEDTAAVQVTSEETPKEDTSAPVAVGEFTVDETPAEEAATSASASDESTAEVISEEAAHADETAQILAQADELIAHQLPDPPVAPDPIVVELPVVEETPTEEAPASEEEATAVPAEEAVVEAEAEESAEDEVLYEDEEEIVPAPKKRRKGLIILAVILALVLLLATSGILFYQHYYLQTIHDMALSGTEDRLTVTLTSDIADEKLVVRCIDPHGTPLQATVENGVASFTGLRPGTKYKVEVRINGFHKLLGETTQTYTTAAQTIIQGFYAAAGPEEGSVILSFTSQGPDSMQWTVTYIAEGEEERTETFTGKFVPIKGLSIGKEYTFTLNPVNELYLSGNNTVTYTVSKLVFAENLEILGYSDNKLGITWTCPEGISVTKWYVRCYNDSGFDKTLTTTDTTFYFEGLDLAAAYKVEVTAEGMPRGVTTSLSANSVTVKDIQADASDRNNLKVQWTFEGTAPEGGWLLLYTVDGSSKQQVVECMENSGVITPLIPGAHYTITVQAAGGVTTFMTSLDYDAADAVPFSGYLVSAENIEYSMCKTPDKDNWNRHDVADSDYMTSFKVGESVSFVMHLDRKTSKSDDMVVTLYVIRDAEGNLVSNAYESRTWDDMWYNRYGKLTIPIMPSNPGTYTVEIYYNGTAATTQTFEILANA